MDSELGGGAATRADAGRVAGERGPAVAGTARVAGEGGPLAGEGGPLAEEYAPPDAAAWDDLVSRSCNGTFLHTRRFLSYHGDRFADRSLLLRDRRGRVTGVFPAAVSPGCPGTVVSHPGLTYGGLVHDGSVRGTAMISALSEIAAHYQRLGYRRLRYKAIPAVYHSAPADDDLYALFRLQARRYRSDLSAAIDLWHRGRVTQRRIRSRKAAEAAGVSTDDSWDGIAGFWEILEDNLARRHATSPVHSLGEIQLLHGYFPDDILLITARASGVLAGGAVLFATGPALHMQYTATTEPGRDACATDLVMEHAIDLARRRGHRFFDFGVSTPDEGRCLDEGLYQFKLSFGAGGVVHDHYEIDLQ
jgi:Acetyltransferase (GNAT) domain